MKRIGVVTVARSDYGIWQPILKRMAADSSIDMSVYVGGMHLEEKYGMTVGMIEADGYPVRARVPMYMNRNDSAGVGVSMGEGVSGFARAFENRRPDILCVLGDRFDMIPAVLAAAPYGLPVAHVHGGEVTEGAMDDLFRHAMTKMSHLHFASTRKYADRLLQMGEEPWRVTVSGAPGLDNVLSLEPVSRAELEEVCGISMNEKPFLITFHPATLESLPVEVQFAELLKGLEYFDRPMVFTMPNADMGGDVIQRAMLSFAHKRPRIAVADNLGANMYFSLMREAAVMIGNSSSGIIEAASFALPVVNVGIRQKGRARNTNVIDCGNSAEAIAGAIHRALKPTFKASLEGQPNIYGDGHAAEIIVNRLAHAEPVEQLIRKRFQDMV